MSGTTAVVFGVLALALAGPVPALLSRARWPYRNPRAALVLWQAIAAAAVLSAFSSGLAIASKLLVVDAQGRPTTSPTAEIDVLGFPVWAAYVLVLAVTLVIGARLIWASVRVAVRTRRRRARHRMLVDLLDDSAADPHQHGADVRVLDSRAPLAYCLPGLRHRVVLSTGTLASLDRSELRAILLHERSHLRARHDLVLEAFTAVNEAFPRIVRSRSALGSVQLLVELLADDSAVKVTGPGPLARALVTCAGSSAPTGAMAAGGASTLVRVQRLSGSGPSALIAGAAYLGAIGILVLPTVYVAVPWLNELSRIFGIGRA